MTAIFTLAFEIGLCGLLAATLCYCVVLDRRLKAVRAGQQDMKSSIGDLNASLATAGASLRALQANAGTIGEALDKRIASARAAIDELSLVAASGERIAQRMERTVDTHAAVRGPIRPTNANLPSGSVMGRLDALRAAR
jgi:ABC-type transporter Mla subunit MlaD